VAQFTISPAAEDDISSILAWTHQRFGERARLRYEALLVQAIFDVADNPERPGSTKRDEIATNVRTYHLFHSRTRVDTAIGRVRRPRHFLIYRFTSEDRIEIGRVLHDSMDLPAHLPPAYRDSSDR
jgi:toxin ParE1/3/4